MKISKNFASLTSVFFLEELLTNYFISKFLLYSTLDVSRTVPFEITIVRPVTKSSQGRTISFFCILHHGSWPWYLVTDEATDFWRKKKKKLAARIWVHRPKLEPKWGFSRFSWVYWFYRFSWGSCTFLENAYNDSLRQYLTSIRGKTHEKKIGEPNWPKSGLKLSFSPFSQVWFISFPLNCIGW